MGGVVWIQGGAYGKKELGIRCLSLLVVSLFFFFYSSLLPVLTGCIYTYRLMMGNLV